MQNSAIPGLKICGMREVGNISAVADLHPDYMGFIFYPGSKRFVGNDFEIPKEFPSDIKRVGVFVNETNIQILRLAERHALDFVQLHGGESIDQCASLVNHGLRVIKAFGIDEQFEFEQVKSYRPFVSYFLFDAKGKNFGGNGISFDWNILHEYDQETPFFLSGGVSLSNVADVGVCRNMNLHALDVNSGVESGIGIKEVELVRRLKLEIKDL